MDQGRPLAPLVSFRNETCLGQRGPGRFLNAATPRLSSIGTRPREKPSRCACCQERGDSVDVCPPRDRHKLTAGVNLRRERFAGSIPAASIKRRLQGFPEEGWNYFCFRPAHPGGDAEAVPDQCAQSPPQPSIS